MTGDGEEEVVIERREVREFVTECLRDGLFARHFCRQGCGDLCLQMFREYFFRKLTNPLFEQGSNDAGVVEIWFV